MKAGDDDHRGRPPLPVDRDSSLPSPPLAKPAASCKINGLRRKGKHDLNPDEMMQRIAGLEKLLYDLIVTQSQRERVLLNQNVKLQEELDRRTRMFNHVLAEYEHRLKQDKQQQQQECDGDVLKKTDGSVEAGTLTKSVSTESDNLDEELHKYDIEYEEVTLDKENTEEKLGLNLCCVDENETDVFVENVDPGGVAGRDGRIKSGDKIIEIDGVDVHTQQQALQLFGADKRAVTLLVARPHLKPERDLTSPDSSTDDCKKSVYSTDSSGERTLLTRLQVQSILEEDEDEENLSTEAADKDELKTVNNAEDENSGVEKDSGVGKTDESTKNEESSEQESFRETSSNDASTQKTLTKMPKESKRSAVNKSEAIEMWVESTASPKHAANEDLCLEMFLPPPPFTDDSDLMSVVSCDNCRRCPCAFSPGELKELDRQEQLARAIKLQQQLSRKIQSNSSSVNSSPSRFMKSEPVLEWRIKRKPDGTKSIVRRPARVKMLKERANQVAEERCGLTTDDDAVSEFKSGRYWTKEDRKKHLERAKARQRHKEEQHYARHLTTTGNENSTQKSILEMSRRKMMRLKGQGVFDDFTTVQELMAHGSHSKNDVKIPHRLLTVTTV